MNDFWHTCKKKYYIICTMYSILYIYISLIILLIILLLLLLLLLYIMYEYIHIYIMGKTGWKMMINMGKPWNNIVEETVWVGKMHTCDGNGRTFKGF